MTLATTTQLGRSLLVLLLGTVLAAGLWLLGLGDIAWIGFIAAAVWWTPMDTDRVDHRSLPAVLSDDPLTSTSVTDLDPGGYRLIPDLSQVKVHATKLKYLRVNATVGQLRGVAEVRDVDGRRELSIHAAAPVVAFHSGNPRRDVHVLQSAFLDARSWPWITYSLDRSTWPSDRIGGMLTVRDARHEVVWRLAEVCVSRDGDLRVRATTTLSRSAFGVSGYRWLVGDQVRVTVDATVRPE
jgi:polyisoprenoid-binding protein YceI